MRPPISVIARILLPALALLAGVRAQAQGRPARLDVVVADSMDRPVPGTRVVVSGSPAPGIADGTGNATVQPIAPGSRLVSIRSPGFREERALLDFTPGAAIAIRVVLTPEPLALDTVVATAERFVLRLHHNGFYKRRQQGLGRFLDRQDVARAERMGGSLCPLFYRIPGFSVSSGSVGVRCVVQSRRGPDTLGSGVCQPAVYIDGMPADMNQLAMLPPEHVEAIEAYAGAAEAPAEYGGASSSCGVIVIWLRRS
jgi:hypothetical protein